MVSGDFAVRFGWSEGDDDTGKLTETVAHFVQDLTVYLSENGAWDINVYGPDGDRISPVDGRDVTRPAYLGPTPLLTRRERAMLQMLGHAVAYVGAAVAQGALEQCIIPGEKALMRMESFLIAIENGTWEHNGKGRRDA